MSGTTRTGPNPAPECGSHESERRVDVEFVRRIRGLARRRAVVAAFTWLVALPYLDVSSNVAVVSDAAPFRCTTGTAGYRPDPASPEAEDAPAVDVLDIEPDMDCVWRFFVRNDSAHEVTVERVSVPALGPGGGGPGLQAVGLGPFESGPLLIDDTDGSVYWDLKDPMFPGEQRYHEIRLEFDETGCSSPGSLTGLAGQPTVDLRFGAPLLPPIPESPRWPFAAPSSRPATTDRAVLGRRDQVSAEKARSPAASALRSPSPARHAG